MQAMTAHVNQLSWRPELLAMAPSGDPLVKGTECHKRDDHSENAHLSIVRRRRVKGNLERSRALEERAGWHSCCVTNALSTTGGEL